MSQLYLIGLTGNIACGKSTVLAQLAARGAAIVDADQVTHQLQQPGEAVYAQIVEQFGGGILLAPGGPIDRRKLGAIVFADPAALRQLEHIVHPAVHATIGIWLTTQQKQAEQDELHVGVIDAIKLLESGWRPLCNAIWVVTCSPEQQESRLVASRGMRPEEARQRITAQPPQAEKVAQADVIIDNSGTLDQTAAQIERAWASVQF